MLYKKLNTGKIRCNYKTETVINKTDAGTALSARGGERYVKGKTVLLGVTGSIAAYKIAYLASALKKLHAQVHVLMTKNATNFINPITFKTLTGNKCLVDTFDGISPLRWSIFLWQRRQTLYWWHRLRQRNWQAGTRHR